MKNQYSSGIAYSHLRVLHHLLAPNGRIFSKQCLLEHTCPLKLFLSEWLCRGTAAMPDGVEPLQSRVSLQFSF